MPKVSLRKPQANNSSEKSLEEIRDATPIGKLFVDTIGKYSENLQERRNKLQEQFEKDIDAARPLTDSPYDITMATIRRKNLQKQFKQDLKTIHMANERFCAAVTRGVEAFNSGEIKFSDENTLGTINSLIMPVATVDDFGPNNAVSQELQTLAETFGLDARKYTKLSVQVNDNLENNLGFKVNSSDVNTKAYNEDLSNMQADMQAQIQVTSAMVTAKDPYHDAAFIMNSKMAQWRKDNPTATTEPSQKEISNMSINKLESISMPNGVTFDNEGGKWKLNENKWSDAFNREGYSVTKADKDDLTQAFVKMIQTMKDHGAKNFKCTSNNPEHLKAFRNAAALCKIPHENVTLLQNVEKLRNTRGNKKYVARENIMHTQKLMSSEVSEKKVQKLAKKYVTKAYDQNIAQKEHQEQMLKDKVALQKKEEPKKDSGPKMQPS